MRLGHDEATASNNEMEYQPGPHSMAQTTRSNILAQVFRGERHANEQRQLKWSGLWSNADGEHARKAVDEFWGWLEKQKKEEAQKPFPDMKSASHER
jgi:hypothetical protein